MRFPPPEVRASWPKPNYDNPVTRGPVLMVVELTLLPIALICVALRLWVRIRWLRKSWWDDWLMVVAAIWSCGTTVLVIMATQLYGWNVHVWDLRVSQMETGRKASMAGQTLFVMASSFVKMSILVSYLRIATRGSIFRKLVWTTFAVVVAAMVVFATMLWAQCTPISSYWNLFADHRDCIDEGPPLVAQTVINCVTDFLIYVLPMPTLYCLQLPTSQRLGLMLLFFFGVLIVVAGSFRAYWVHFTVYKTYDVSWEGFQIWVWTAIETNCGVCCGCIPSLKPLLFRSRSQLSSAKGPKAYGSSTSRRQPQHTADKEDADTHELTATRSSSLAEYGASVQPCSVSDASNHSLEAGWEQQKVYV